MSYHLVSDDVISHDFSSHLVSPLVSSHCLSSIHLMSSYLISSHLFSSLLISSHPSIASHSISSHHIISYHLSSSQTSSTIIFHISRHPFSSTQWKTTAPLCIAFLHPPGPQVPHTIFVRFNVSMPLFSSMNIKHPSIREWTNGRRSFGFGPVSTFDRPGPLPQHTSWNCWFAVPVGVQGYSGSSQPDSWNLRHAWKSCIKLHRLHRLHRLNTFTFMLAMSAHCPKPLQHIWMSLDFSLGRLGDTILDVQWPSVTQYDPVTLSWQALTLQEFVRGCRQVGTCWDMLGYVGTCWDWSDLTDQNSHSKMANVASAQLQKSAGQLALMVMRITSSKAGMMNVDECWTFTTQCMRFTQIYEPNPCQTGGFARFCSLSGVTPEFSQHQSSICP